MQHETGGAALHFADRVAAAVDLKSSCLVVGLDPVLEQLPLEVCARVRGSPGEAGWTARAAVASGFFLDEVLEQVAPHAVAVKPNTAFFERLGAAGWDCLQNVCARARKLGLLVIVDAKRGDIGHTAAAYADGLLGGLPDTVGAAADAVTLSPYLGEDSVAPFLSRAAGEGKGVFVLVRTSNPSAGAVQDLETPTGRVCEVVARLVAQWGAGSIGSCGLSAAGAVVGGTAPEQAIRLRRILQRAIFLVPGYGAQGARVEDLRPLFLPGGRGVLVNASRSILYARPENAKDWREAVAGAAKEARDELERARGGAS